MPMLRSDNQIIGVMIILLFLSYGIAKANPFEFQINTPLVESINQDARHEYHLHHPTWREFSMFQ